MISELTKKLIEKFSVELKEPNNFNKIKQNFLNPLIHHITIELYPYFLFILILFLLISIISLINFVILIKIFTSKKI